MELMDKQKLLEWLDEQRKTHKLRNRYDEHHQGMQTMIDYTVQAIDLGTFDDHSAQQEIAKLKEGLETVVGAHIITMQRAIQAEQEREILAEFIRDMIRDGCWNIDGGELQDKAEKLGLLRVEIYDPEKHGDDFDGEPGEDEIYVFSGLLEKTKP